MAKPVEGFATSGRRKPCAWGSGQAVLGPGFKCGGERVLQRILGELKVAEDADQRCQDRTGLGSKYSIESARTLAHVPLLTSLGRSSAAGFRPNPYGRRGFWRPSPSPHSNR